MTTSKKIFKDDVGILFRVYSKYSLTDATSIVFDVKKPDGNVETWTATMASDNNYYAEYTTVSGDLDIVGEWKLSLQIQLSGGKIFTGETDYFNVYDQFEDDVNYPRIPN
jgi:hypothetical protein